MSADRLDDFLKAHGRWAEAQRSLYGEDELRWDHDVPTCPGALPTSLSMRKRSVPPGTNLRGAKLRAVDFRGAVLAGVDFRGADLKDCRFIEGDLKGARFDRADLESADFRGARLTDASFLDASLVGAKLGNAVQLEIGRLGGADLRGASLPDRTEFPAIKDVESTSGIIQGLFKLTLAICVVASLTVLSFRDEQLLDHRTASTPFPTLGVSVTPAVFSVVVPLALLLLHAYSQFYYRDLLVALGGLPAIFVDGTPLDRMCRTTTLTSYLRRHVRRLETHSGEAKSRLSYYYAKSLRLISAFNGLCVTPTCLFVLWLVSIRRQDWAAAFVQCSCVAAVAGLSMSMAADIRNILSHSAAEPDARDVVDRSNGRVPWLVLVALGLVLALWLISRRPWTNDSVAKEWLCIRVACGVYALAWSIFSFAVDGLTGRNRSARRRRLWNDASTPALLMWLCLVESFIWWKFAIPEDSRDMPMWLDFPYVLVFSGLYMLKSIVLDSDSRRPAQGRVEARLLSIVPLLFVFWFQTMSVWYSRNENIRTHYDRAVEIRAGWGEETADIDDALHEYIAEYGSELRPHPLERFLKMFGYGTHQDLSGRQLSTRPANSRHDPGDRDAWLDDVVGIDLEDESMMSADFAGALLAKANLRGARLCYANLRDADLTEADLREADLRGAILRNTSLRRVKLQGALLDDAIVRGIDPFEPNLEGAVDVQGAQLSQRQLVPLRHARNLVLAYWGTGDDRLGALKRLGVDHRPNAPTRIAMGSTRESFEIVLKKVKEEGGPTLRYRPDEDVFQRRMACYDFSGLNMAGALLDKFDLTNAVFRKTNLKGASLRGADLTGASFDGADLSDADLTGAIGFDPKKSGARLNGAQLPEAPHTRPPNA